MSRAAPELLDASAADIKEHTMDLEAALRNGFPDRRVVHEHLDSRLDVELGDADDTLLLVGDGVELLGVVVADRLEREQPGVKDTADAAVRESARGAAAGRVAAENNVLDLEVGDSVLDHGSGVDVGGGDNVGNVAVDKDVTGLHAQDCGLGAARVRATDPDCCDHVRMDRRGTREVG